MGASHFVHPFAKKHLRMRGTIWQPADAAEAVGMVDGRRFLNEQDVVIEGLRMLQARETLRDEVANVIEAPEADGDLEAIVEYESIRKPRFGNRCPKSTEKWGVDFSNRSVKNVLNWS
jgi:hypothetical protein